METSKKIETIKLPQGEGVKANNKQGEGSPSQGHKVLVEAPSVEQGAEIDRKQPENMEDVSFSDMEDDDNDLSDRLSISRSRKSEWVSSPNGSNEWVRLNENSVTRGGGQKQGQSSTFQEKDSEGEDSTGWLTVDEVDLDSLASV
ncbi:hypothetical protein U1Q18_028298 [Sarracenia purpurea var. burkii]